MVKLKSLVPVHSLNESIKPSDTIKKVQQVAKSKQEQEIDGYRIDTTVANYIMKAWNMASDKNKRKMNNLSAENLADVAWKMIEN